MLNVRRFLACVEATNIFNGNIFKRHAGHSKWANIKHTKALKDDQKSIMFTKVGKLIKLAVHEGGSPNPELNVKLAQAMSQGRRMSMPVTTMENIIKSTQKDAAQSKLHIFEIRGPGGCMVICEAFTPNVTGTKMLIAGLLKRNRSKYSDTSLRHLFEHKGVIETEVPAVDGIKNEDELMEMVTNHAVEGDAEDVVLVNSDGSKFLRFITDNMNFSKVQKHLENLNYTITNTSLDFIPIQLVKLNEGDLQTYQTLYEKLTNLDDVVRLHDNIDE